MLEWFWLHMAINAGGISTISKYGDLNDAAASTEVAMNSPRIRSEVVRVIREAVKSIVQKGVQLNNYKNELLPYKIPAPIAGWVMVKMFQNNELTRRIMLLHSNIDDLLFVCSSVYEFGRKNQVDAPLFYKNFEIMQKKVA